MFERLLSGRPLLRRLLLVLVPAAAVAVAAAVWLLRPGAGGRPPGPGSPAYRDIVSAFYVGTIALQTGEYGRAGGKLETVTRLAPQEPAGWANLGLLHLRAGRFDESARALAEARRLAPRNGAVAQLEGLLAQRQGRFADAAASFRRAIDLDPSNLKAIYALAQVLPQLGGADADAEALPLMERILTLQPGNLVALLERARILAKRGDAAGLRETLTRLKGRNAASWPPEAREQLRALEAAAGGGDVRPAAIQVALLTNTLRRFPGYRAGVEAVSDPAAQTGMPLERFLVLETPRATPAPPDTGLAYASEPLAGGTAAPAGAAPAAVVRAVPLDATKPPALFVADGRAVRRPAGAAAAAALPFPGGGAAGTAPTPDGVLALDIDNDFKGDLALAGAAGVRLFLQTANGGFSDVTARTRLPAAVLNAPYTGAWALDVEADGDLDVLLGAASGPPLVLRNNGDGSFVVQQPFGGVSGVRQFAWADLDGDGDPDAALVDAAGRLRVFDNERSGLFRVRAVPADLGAVLAVTAADADRDGVIDLVVAKTGGGIVGLHAEPGDDESGGGGGWRTLDLVQNSPAGDRPVRLLAADLDNNGAFDLVFSQPGGAATAWLADGTGKFAPLGAPLGADVQDVADLNGDGALDLVGIGKAGAPVRLLAKTTKGYRWQAITLTAKYPTIENRINSFGIGGEIEIRSGLLYQKQPITRPQVHFGLGDRAQVDASRITWPTGNAQGEFDLAANQTLSLEQRLGGSCPFLFAWDGSAMRFVTDCIWRSPLGLRINAQDTLGKMQTQDWVKIRGDQLAARDGVYDLRVTGELRETHFFDHLSLMVVDHPEDTDVFVDERLAVPQPPLAVYATTRPRPMAGAWDDRGRNVAETVRAIDGRYLDFFGRGRYQGVTREHFVEVALGDEAPRDRPIYLIAHGWIHPTDSSINVALGQNPSAAPPQGLSLLVPDADGRWSVAKPGLGFPEGKVKTIVIRVDDAFRPGAPRRFRLQTNLEIFWDSLAWAEGLPDAPVKKQRLAAASAELRYRGFSVVTAKDASSPELPGAYDELTGTEPRWRDLIGYYTRYGGVGPLLGKIDDRYVIMNAGDEIALRFTAPPPPPPGWKRDFVLVGDGWVKDGNVNTAFGKTVLPLPLHGRDDYSRPPGRLEDDPAYRRNPSDWKQYHTRYVTPTGFGTMLKPAAVAPPKHGK